MKDLLQQFLDFLVFCICSTERVLDERDCHILDHFSFPTSFVTSRLYDNWNNGGLRASCQMELLASISQHDSMQQSVTYQIASSALLGVEGHQQEDIAEKYAQKPDLQSRCLAALCPLQICSLSSSTNILGDHGFSQTYTDNHIVHYILR